MDGCDAHAKKGDCSVQHGSGMTRQAGLFGEHESTLHRRSAWGLYEMVMLAYLIYSLAMAHDNEVLPLLCWLLGRPLGVIRGLNLCGGFFSNLNLGTCKPDQVLSCHSNNLVTTCIDLR